MLRDKAHFRDRPDAGRRLAEALMRFADIEPLILALPRGGVPVAFEIAKALDAPLDVLFVRKIGAPGHAEYGIGAVVDGADPQLVLNDEAMEIFRPPRDYIETEKKRQLAEIERRRMLYAEGRRPLPVKGRSVILVDDGIATGGTVLAALKALRKDQAARIILAVPVAPGESLALVGKDADEVVCLATPEPFLSVGLQYEKFGQTTDEEVISLLREAERFGNSSMGR
ncbi:phosphoribosyltransferase [Phyllobacterium leguminum]|uniref:Putative phosphoribosyl transferase n=1 Tax=Phyllobacterium leguminum TaxID=314237 RepID=A0A318THD0_9HYPH|nr:phosphoribosyltransferase [Phyllobacterium leguminum]PYE88224.1 putative phosphoribosyl transferase [Phyllobacterium leguminum]